MAIMGFGGGAFLAGYLNVFFMDRLGVANTVMTLGATYLAIMLIGSRLLERPARWLEAGGVDPRRPLTRAMIADRRRHAESGDPDKAVLPLVGHPLHQRHRRDRHFVPGRRR